MTGRISDILPRLKELADTSENRRLPSVRELAATWGASPGTIHSAVREAAARGWIETRPGSGIWAQGASPAARPIAPRLDSRRIAEGIGEEIRSGKRLSGELLPAQKEYARLREVHPSTVRKAFASLLSDGNRSVIPSPRQG